MGDHLEGSKTPRNRGLKMELFSARLFVAVFSRVMTRSLFKKTRVPSMNKKQSKALELAADPRFIKGIYNYCDRWCERCAYTSRCLLFAGEERARDTADPEEASDFWKQLESTLQSAQELIVSIMEERDIDPAELESAPSRPIRDRQNPLSGELSRAVREYQKLTQSWLEKHTEEVAPAFDDEPADDWEAAIQVISWYRFQIGAKLHRGLQGRLDFEEEQEEAAMDDANGSIKVALIGIDRSRAAWTLLNRIYPHSSEVICEILLRLDRLRRKVESEFPEARSFQRPGFDYSTAVQ
jgi:hypothetical protein